MSFRWKPVFVILGASLCFAAGQALRSGPEPLRVDAPVPTTQLPAVAAAPDDARLRQLEQQVAQLSSRLKAQDAPPMA
ncbi:MAG: hypothetical protein EOO71_31645, partial [Myxococcaceae bacterium]